MRGRKPRSKAEKIARGTRRSRVNYDEPDVPPPDNTKPPNLKGAGLALWRGHMKAMVATGQLRRTDVPLFASHCRTMSDIEFWRAEMSKPNLDRSMMLQIQRTIDRLGTLAMRQAAELGMTAVSRSRVKTMTKPPVEKPTKDRFFGKGRKPRVLDGGRA